MAKAVPLSEANFIVVDIETTGSIPEKHAILEIGAVKVVGGRILDRYQSLINPKQDIPAFIQDLTGITPPMVEKAPRIQEAMEGFWDFLGDRIFVAHHAPFDFGFLNRVTKNLLGSGLDNTQVCTYRLAKKLLPGVRRKNLGALAQYFKIPVEDRHRALGDAEATARVLIEFLKMVEQDGIQTLGKLLDYQRRGNKRYVDIKIPFPEYRSSEFPERPGVYFMRDEKGEILYIGKAKNLKKRLQSYFYNLYRQTSKVQEMLQQVYDIETKVLGSELEALLEESFLIKKHQPYYNRQIKNYRTFPFLKITVQEAFPKIEITSEIENDHALYFGPYQRKRHLATMVESLTRVFQLRSCPDKVYEKHRKIETPCMAYQIGTCSGPCAGKVTIASYRTQVEDIVNFLEGRVSDLTEIMVKKRDTYSEAMQFEKAKHIQERLLELLKLQANTKFLSQAVHQNHLLIALPDREQGRKLLMYVYKGRPLYKQVFDPATDDPETILERVSLIVRMLESKIEEKQETIDQAELEEIKIIAHWLKECTPDETTRIINLTQPFEKIRREIYELLENSAITSPFLKEKNMLVANTSHA